MELKLLNKEDISASKKNPFCEDGKYNWKLCSELGKLESKPNVRHYYKVLLECLELQNNGGLDQLNKVIEKFQTTDSCLKALQRFSCRDHKDRNVEVARIRSELWDLIDNLITFLKAMVDSEIGNAKNNINKWVEEINVPQPSESIIKRCFEKFSQFYIASNVAQLCETWKKLADDAEKEHDLWINLTNEMKPSTAKYVVHAACGLLAIGAVAVAVVGIFVPFIALPVLAGAATVGLISLKFIHGNIIKYMDGPYQRLVSCVQGHSKNIKDIQMMLLEMKHTLEGIKSPEKLQENSFGKDQDKKEIINDLISIKYTLEKFEKEAKKTLEKVKTIQKNIAKNCTR